MKRAGRVGRDDDDAFGMVGRWLLHLRALIRRDISTYSDHAVKAVPAEFKTLNNLFQVVIDIVVSIVIVHATMNQSRGVWQYHYLTNKHGSLISYHDMKTAYKISG